MKVALVLSGHYRSFDKTKHSLIKHVLSLYSPDIFFHLWTDSVGFRRGETTQEECKTMLGYEESQPPLLDYQINDVINTLTPKRYIIEKQKDLDSQFQEQSIAYTDKTSCWADRIRANTAMFYAKRKAYSLIDSKYDVIIHTRFDIFYSADLKIIQDDQIHCPIEQSYGIFSDIFIYGNQKNMDIVDNMPDHLDEILKYVPYNAHQLFAAWVKTINNINFSIDPIALGISR